MEKIDINKIRGEWQEWGNDVGNGMRPVAGGNDTVESMRTIADKVNEIIDFITPLVQEKVL